MKNAKMYINNNFIEEICVADTFFTRFQGLMLKSDGAIRQLKGLLIKPCSQIHTFFMKAPIDVVYADKTGKVLKTDKNVLPGKCCKTVKNARWVLEFPVGSIEKWHINTDDTVEVKSYGRQ